MTTDNATPHPVRLGLVGCGRLVEAGYVPAASATPAVRIVAVADLDRSRAKRVADLIGPDTQVFGSSDELSTHAELDGLVVATPAAAHLGDARSAIHAGVPVLVEKPPAPDLATAVELAELDGPLWVGFNRRFDFGAQRTHDLITGSSVVDLKLSIHYRRAGWGPHVANDDALLDLGPHLVDWARWISGQEVVHATNVTLSPTRFSADLVLERGRARIDGATDRPHRELIQWRSTKGHIVARHRTGGLTAAVLDRLTRTAGPDAMVTTLAAQLAVFAESIRSQDQPRDLGTADDGVAVMAVLDAISASAANRGLPAPVRSVPATDPT